MRMGARLIEVSTKPRCDYYTITIKGKVRKPKPTQAGLNLTTSLGIFHIWVDG